jgi:hypothetical protein
MGPRGMLNQSDQATQFGHFSHVNPPYQQWFYQLTEMISVTLQILHGFLYGSVQFLLHRWRQRKDQNAFTNSPFNPI